MENFIRIYFFHYIRMAKEKSFSYNLFEVTGDQSALIQCHWNSSFIYAIANANAILKQYPL